MRALLRIVVFFGLLAPMSDVRSGIVPALAPGKSLYICYNDRAEFNEVLLKENFVYHHDSPSSTVNYYKIERPYRIDHVNMYHRSQVCALFTKLPAKGTSKEE